jgi:TrmH family RNA methyltransferase
MQEILSKDNYNVKQYIKLKSSKRQRMLSELFVVEGVKLCLEAVKENLEIQKVFITQKCIDRYGEQLEEMTKLKNKTYIIAEDIDLKMSDTITPQGVFMLCKKLNKTLSIEKIKNSKSVIGLCNLQDPGNIGTIIRTAEALGIDGIIASTDCCDLFSPKVIRATMGSIFRVKILFTTNIEDLINTLNSNNITTIASVVDETACDVSKFDFPTPSVVFIGNEGNGLPASISSICSQKVTIKMAGNSESLNASIASSIIMWEISKR